MAEWGFYGRRRERAELAKVTWPPLSVQAL
jgi:hypothetical protein